MINNTIDDGGGGIDGGSGADGPHKPPPPSPNTMAMIWQFMGFPPIGVKPSDMVSGEDGLGFEETRGDGNVSGSNHKEVGSNGSGTIDDQPSSKNGTNDQQGEVTSTLSSLVVQSSSVEQSASSPSKSFVYVTTKEGGGVGGNGQSNGNGPTGNLNALLFNSAYGHMETDMHPNQWLFLHQRSKRRE